MSPTQLGEEETQHIEPVPEDSKINQATETSLWSSLSHNSWFTLCIAEDWVRLNFLSQLTNTDPNDISTHSPGHYCKFITKNCPPLADIISIVLANTSDTAEDEASIQKDTLQLALELEELLLPVTMPDIKLNNSAFWSFIANFLLAIQIPSAGPRYELPSAYQLRMKKRRSLKVTHSKGMGFGLITTTFREAGSPIPHLWGDLIPLSRQDQNTILQLNKAGSRTLVCGDNSEVLHLLLGPISLINESCPAHANLLPDKDPTSRPRDAISQLSDTDWRYAYAAYNIRPGQTLTFSYGPTYSKENEEDSDLECEDCPFNQRTRCPDMHRLWMDLAPLKNFHLLLAEDWVRLAVLAPLTDTPPDKFSTHSIGTTRSDILNLSLPWDEIRAMCNEHAKRADLAKALAEGHQELNKALSPFLLQTGRATEFWMFAARFLDSLSWTNHGGKGRFVCEWYGVEGAGLTQDNTISGETALPKLWGERIALSTEAYQTLARIDNATTRSLLLGTNTHHVVIGPLGLLNHRCPEHANLLPAKAAHMESRATPSGLSILDWRGAHKPIESPTIHPGEQLTITYSEGDGHPACQGCTFQAELAPRSDPLPEEAESNARTWDMACSLSFFVAGLADDWVRMSFILPGNQQIHSFQMPTYFHGGIREAVKSCIPSRQQILDLLYQDNSAQDLKTRLTLAFKVPHMLGATVQLPPELFWTAVADMIANLDIPPNPKQQMTIEEASHYKMKQWRITYHDRFGFSLLSTTMISTGETLPDLRATRHALSEDDQLTWFKLTGDMATHITLGLAGFVQLKTTRACIEKTNDGRYTASRDLRRFATIYEAPIGGTYGILASTPPFQISPTGNTPRSYYTGLSREELEEHIALRVKPKPVRRRHQHSLPKGWDGHHMDESKTTKLMRFFTQNIHLSRKTLETNLLAILRSMYKFDMSVGALTETNAHRRHVAVDSDGIAQRGLIAGGTPINYHSLWSFCPKGKAGSGVTLCWDSRIPHANPYTDKAGRLAAVTLQGPSTKHVRVIGLYAPANPTHDVPSVIALHRELLNQLSYARRNNLAVVVMGDFNDTVKHDTTKFSHHARTYSTAKTVKEYSLINCLETRGMIDSFRRLHPDLHGATFHRKHWHKPSRIDFIWVPKAWETAFSDDSSTTGSVDTGKTFCPHSDHRALMFATTFRRVFNAPSEEVRHRDRRTMTTGLDHRLLVGEKLSLFLEFLEDKVPDLREQVNSWYSCECQWDTTDKGQEESCEDDILEEAPHWFPPPPAFAQDGSVIPQDTLDRIAENRLRALAAQGKVDSDQPAQHTFEPARQIHAAHRNGRQNPACTCASDKPANAKELLTAFMEEWNTHIINALPERTEISPKAVGPSVKSSKEDKIAEEAIRLRTRLRFATPSGTDLVQAESDWNTLQLKVAACEHIKYEAQDMPDPTPNPERWAARVSAECSIVDTLSKKYHTNTRKEQTKKKMSKQYIDDLIRLDQGGHLPPSLKRVTRKNKKPDHLQASTPEGGATTDPIKIKERMEKVFTDWFSAKKGKPGGAPTVAAMYAPYTDTRRDICYHFGLSELKDTIKKAPADSCPGPSGISIPIIKLLPDSYLQILSDILNLCLAWGELPTCFDEAFIYPIPKKNAFTVENSRPISLLEVHLKLLTRLVNNRLTWTLLEAEFFSSIQFGFLPGRSCTDAYHILLGAVEDSVEHNKQIHLTLVDLTKAFDSLSPESLQDSYELAGLDNRTKAFLGALDGTGSAKVLTPWGPSNSINMKWGVRQGEVLSPCKFIIWLNAWLKHVADTMPDVGYTMLDEHGAPFNVCLLAFADDIAIVTKNHEEMQRLMTSLCDFLHYHGVTLSANAKAEDSKTHYVTNAKKKEVLHLRCYNRKSSPGKILPPERIALRARASNTILVYLGGHISLDLNWAAIRKVARQSLQVAINKLYNPKISLAEALARASSVVAGKAGYLLQVCRFTKTMLLKLDSSLNKALKKKTKLAMGSSAHGLHSPKSIGMGLFTMMGLAQQTCITELLVRLNSPGLQGRVARSRWNAAFNNTPDFSLPSATLPRQREHFTLYCAELAKRAGCQIYGPQNREQTQQAFQQEHPLSAAINLTRLQALDLRDKGFIMGNQVWNKNGSLKSWEELRARRLKYNATAAWYKDLESTPPPIFPKDICTTAQGDLSAGIEHPTAGFTTWRAGHELFIAEEIQKLTQQECPEDIPFPRNWDSQNSLLFFTDGSLNHRNAEIVGGACSVTPSELPGWDRVPGRPYYSRHSAHATMGAEPISIGTMELQAILEIAEHAPRKHIKVYVDASYILNGIAKGQRHQRRITRCPNRPLWNRFWTALRARKSDGLEFLIEKCSSHEKNPDQHPTISKWNTRADAGAKAAAHARDPQITWWPEGDDNFGLMHEGRTVRGDPRHFLKTLQQQDSLTRWTALHTDGLVAQQLTSITTLSRKGGLKDLRSATKLARAGHFELHQFAFGYQSMALPTPSRIYTIDEDNLQCHNPTQDGKNICPMCGDTQADNWHGLITCPTLINLQKPIRAAAATLIEGLQVISTPPEHFIEDLLEWLETALDCPTNSSSIINYTEDTPQAGGHIGLQILSGAAQSKEDRIDTSWTKHFKWPLVLTTASTVNTLIKAKKTVRVIMSFPKHRFPGPMVDDTRTYLPECHALCFLHNKELPPLESHGAKGTVEHLSNIVSRSILWGTHCLSLAWRHTSWRLDHCNTTSTDRILAEAGLLPLRPDKPVYGEPTARNASAISWLGILPKNLGDATEESLKQLPADRKREFLSRLTTTILEGQKGVWHTVRKLYIMAWKRLKAIKRAKALGKPPPKYRPLRVTPDTHLASFPPSQRVHNLAIKYLGEGGSLESVAAFARAAPLLAGIAQADIEDVWMSTQKIRHTFSEDTLKALSKKSLDNLALAGTLLEGGICIPKLFEGDDPLPQDNDNSPSQAPRSSQACIALSCPLRGSPASTSPCGKCGGRIHRPCGKQRGENAIWCPGCFQRFSIPTEWPGFSVGVRMPARMSSGPTPVIPRTNQRPNLLRKLQGWELPRAKAILAKKKPCDITHNQNAPPNGQRPTDIQSLGPRQWVSEKVMTTLINKLRGWLYSPMPLIRLEGSEVYTAITGPLPGASRVRLAARMLQQKHTFLPCLLDNHWLLAVVTFNPPPMRSTLQIIDSKKSHRTKIVADNILSFLRNPPPGIQWETEWSLETPICGQQDNGFDCGIHLIGHLLCITQGIKRSGKPKLWNTPRPLSVAGLRIRTVSLLSTQVSCSPWGTEKSPTTRAAPIRLDPPDVTIIRHTPSDIQQQSQTSS